MKEKLNLKDTKILVVDDFQTNLEMTTIMLRKYGIEAHCVSSGKDAYELINLGKPVFSAIFMDYIMPDMDGIEAVKLIRLLDTEYSKTIPIIAISSNAVRGNEQIFLDSGFNAILTKPINILDLEVLINKLFLKDSAKYSAVHNSTEANAFFAQKIAGLNMKSVHELYDGDEEFTVFAFNSFIVNTPPSIGKLRHVFKENLPDYVITVHSLKSTTASIGAEEISAKAAKLETLAKNGDISGVLAENEGFLSEIEVLIDNLKAVVRQNSQKIP